MQPSLWLLVKINRDYLYYPIDPWSLEGLLFNCAAMGLRVSIIFKISFRDNSRDNYFLKNIGTILGTILYKAILNALKSTKKD